MAINKSIFALRHRSNVRLTPTQEELGSFLNSLKKAGGQVRHNRDLARYGEMLAKVESFKNKRQLSPATDALRERMLYSVLRHSCFFNPSLKLSVEQYKYYLHVLTTMDFKKPAMFIASAEQEMQKLNPKKQQDVIKLARLRGLVNERKRTLEALQRDRIDLASELLEIARYISENLSKIADLCRSVIGALGSANTKGTEERCFLEEITTRFQEALKNAPRGGAMTPADLNSAKRDAAILSQEFAELLREDISALSGLYEAIQNHTRQAAQKIGSLVGAIEKSKGRLLEEEARTFRTIEEALVSLLTDHDFQLQVSTTRSQTLRRDILVERRSEMLDSLLQQVQQERRGRYERRSGKDRRTAGEENYQGLERRRGRDRRAGKKRRHSEYSP